MGIWASVGTGGEVRASDLHDPTTHRHTGAGSAGVVIDVATATSWNDRIRLALWDASFTLDVCLVLDDAAAALLIERLTAAREIVARTSPDRGRGE